MSGLDVLAGGGAEQFAATRSLSALSGGLAEIRRAAHDADPAAALAVAKKFEGMFIKMMLDAMRATGVGDSLFNGHGSLLYRDLMDTQIADSIAEGKGMGLADVLARQIQRAANPNPPETNAERVGGVELPVRRYPYTASRAAEFVQRDAAIKGPPVAPSAPTREHSATAAATILAEPKSFSNPQDFVRVLAPHARRAGAELGISPRVLIAQAALETGWGQRLIRHPDGRNSFNLFGIKADDRWPGERVTTRTLEFAEGTMQKTMAGFRSYSGLRESFSDYVSFVRNDPRYQTALQRSADPEQYIKALHKAGYATDPGYANKVISVMRRPLLHSVPATTRSL